MKKIYNTPETQLHVMDAQDGFLNSISDSTPADPTLPNPQEIPGMDEDLFGFKW